MPSHDQNAWDRRAIIGVATAGLALVTAPRATAAESAVKRVEPESVPQKEGVAELPNAKLWYWDTGGKGEAVVFLHAGTGSGLVWGYQQPVFARAGYRAIGYSRRGFYGSSAAGGGMAGDVADLDALMTSLGVDKFHAVGSAGGGITATAYALAHPERLLSLTLACSIVGVQDPDYVRRSNDLRPKGFDDMPPDFREIGPSYRASNPDGVARWLELEHMARAGVAPAAGPPPGAVAGGPPPSGITWAKLEAMRTPTLLITGDADLYTPPSVLRDIGKHMPSAEVQVIDEAGHSAYWEQPEAFNRLVLNFVGKHKKA